MGLQVEHEAYYVVAPPSRKLGGDLRVLVQKYGGSSVSDLKRIRAVARRIQETVEAGFSVIAVVSAMGNTTNELLTLAHDVSPHPDLRELDMLISVGERITMSLLAMALRDLGVAARSLTGSQSGIITDEHHANASVVEVRPERVLQVLGRGEVAIVAGFQGVSREREVTTLGRGGSDMTAVALAAAVSAEACEICSDVDGVWSADPRVEDSAARMDEMAIDAALTLARGGAKVLFEDAVRYARDHGVQVRAVSTFGPGSGTRMSAEGATRSVAVTHDEQLVRIPDAPGLASAVASAGGRLRRIAQGQWYVDIRNAHGGLPVEHAQPTSMVTAVASGLGQDPDAFAVARSLAKPFEPRALGAEGDAIWFEVGADSAKALVSALHQGLNDQQS